MGGGGTGWPELIGTDEAARHGPFAPPGLHDVPVRLSNGAMLGEVMRARTAACDARPQVRGVA
ncbi:MAG: hypothetical protein EKK53_26080 [Burkholderiales bacterium]|nr:MAG: hypothetical protein EKK53_26080 [Burkholderiales bacterium]